jgi:hypothetical protein
MSAAPPVMPVGVPAFYDDAEMQQPHASRRDYERAFEGIEFPASYSEITKRARDTGGIDREVHEMIGRLPDRQYASLDDLFAELRAVYASAATPAEAIPV